MVRDVTVTGPAVSVTIALTVAGCPMKANLEGRCGHHVGAARRVEAVSVAFDVMTPEQRTALRQRLQGGGAGGEGEAKTISLSPRTRVIAVASGKGGVGKSTLTANLAAALAMGGAEVGVVDATLRLFAATDAGREPPPGGGGQDDVPPVNHDLKVMSIGFFTEPDAAVVWRGPMLHRALEQFLSDVHWGELDYLVVDMPPGTGDVSISLGQLLPRPTCCW